MRKMRIDEDAETEDNIEDDENGVLRTIMMLIIDYNDDEYKDIGKVTEMKIGQEDEENEDR